MNPMFLDDHRIINVKEIADLHGNLYQKADLLEGHDPGSRN